MEMEEMDLREYWEILVKKRLLIGAIFLVTVLAVTIYSLVATPIYEASTTIMVRDQSATSAMAMFDTMGSMGKNTAQNYIQIMKSRLILEQVASTVGNPDLNLEFLEKQITIQPIQSSDILKISLQSADPAEAQNVVNTLTAAFIEWNRLYQQEDRRSARVFIESQLETVSRDLQVAEEKLKAYKEQERVLAPSQQTIAGIDQLTSLEKSLSQVQISQAEAKERMAQIRAKLAEQEETLISSTTIGSNTFVVQYTARLADLEISLSGAKEKYTDLHPSVLALQAEIEDVKEKLTEQVERVIGTETRSINPLRQELYAQLIGLEVEVMALDAREIGLASLVTEAERHLDSLPAKELELARLMRDAKVLEELYLMLRSKNEETKIAEVMQTADVQVIDEAILPIHPVKPRVKLNIAIGAVLGMFLGVGVAFLVEFMDTTLKTKDEAEKLLDLAVLGQIPDFDLLDQDQKKRTHTGIRPLIVHDDPKAIGSEAFRTLRTNLQFTSPDLKLKTILVTSAGPEDGKSTISSNLAVAWAQAGNKTLLVGCDLRKPVLHEIFKTNNTPGLTGYLSGAANLADVIQKTRVEGLDLIPAGPIPPNPAELLQSKAMAKLIAQVQDDYDRVIFDGAPTVAVTDAGVVASQIDGTILVLRAHKVPKDVAEHAKALLAQANARILGVVLNGVRPQDQKNYNYYYYYDEKDRTL